MVSALPSSRPPSRLSASSWPRSASRSPQLTQERDRWVALQVALRIELELLKRRLFVANAERIDTEQLELEFAATLAALDKLAGMSPLPHEESEDDKKATKIKPKGRRDIRKLALEEERIEISDPLFEKLVAEGKAEQIGYEESCKLGFKRGGFRRVVVAGVKYQATDNQGESCVETALMPPRNSCPGHWRRLPCSPTSLRISAAMGCPCSPSRTGFPGMGVPLDRGMMSRWLEEIGGAVGPTILAAAKKDALATAFCISTDATGISVQPTPRPDKKDRPVVEGTTPCSWPTKTTSSSSTPHTRRARSSQRCSKATRATSKRTPRASTTSSSASQGRRTRLGTTSIGPRSDAGGTAAAASGRPRWPRAPSPERALRASAGSSLSKRLGETTRQRPFSDSVRLTSAPTSKNSSDGSPRSTPRSKTNGAYFARPSAMPPARERH